ncbi:PREDICTED: probable pectinesterase/pectinesterase inhibitor 58 isoform X1 [Lupinus angustifolius]|uniref:probable pectinesterase/pectinesterase inhibitor 58 isoform X1 n=1 Tax=Lupinus angustifolius TaxID=3871 RepID=UPI00092EF067|nr:PREDICTED: probable pectinesterase/pectinesterase inhibitor 58 isoform X1 [Lupinus angustifolius]
MSGGGEEKRKRIVIIGFSTLLLVAMIVVVIMGISNETEFNDDNDDDIEDNQKHVASTMKAVKTLCYPTDYKKECEENLMPAAGNTTDPKELVKIAFNVAISRIGDKLKQTEILHELENEPRAKLALETCKQLMDLSIDEFLRSLDQIREFDLINVDKIFTSVKVWLSGAITYQDTCLDGFENTTSEASKKMKDLLTTSMHMSSNALAIITNMADTIADWNVTRLLGGRRLLEESKNENSFNLPTWVDDAASVHKILAETPFKIKPNVTVALDGTGDFKSINKALKKVPSDNEKPFVIYIKKGIYHEYVHVTKDMTNVVFIGDGGDKTRITGNKNFIDGVNTYNTTTVAIQGDHFIAINMGFENSAGPHKHQAVAIRVQADKSIFYKCQFDGYQDTLYAHTHRQFYRDCIISGTIDFIFGDAIAVFQNCTFIVRKPMSNQNCIVTAQGRKDRHQPTGIVIQGGSIVADPMLQAAKLDHKSYLARPWKNFSRTIFMDTFIDGFIDPEGFLAWQGEQGPMHMNTCFYSEYHNYGPGSDKSKRAHWAGIWNLNSKAAHLFQPSKFFHGDDWIEDAGIPYFSGIPKHYRHKMTVRNWLPEKEDKEEKKDKEDKKN